MLLFSFLILIIGFISVKLIKYLVVQINLQRRLPPGPWGFPIIGYLPLFKSKHNYLRFDELSKKYGPVFSLKLGIHNVVVICDWNHLKEAFANDALLARPLTSYLPGIFNSPSILQMSGDFWREHRRVSLHVLRDIGFGKSTMENLISQEIDSFLSTLENGPVTDFNRALAPSVSNNISALLFGHTFDYNDPDKVTLDESVDKFSQFFKFAGISTLLPWLTKPLVALGIMNMDKICKSLMDINDFAQKEIDKHQERMEPGKVLDYIDGYLHEQRKRKDDTFSVETLRRNISAFFGAGSETVTSTFTWIVLYLVKYSEYQEKIRQEINEAIGPDRKPEYSDRSRTPFTNAFICEVHRIASIVPANLIRRASRDTKVGTYEIPKDTLVIFNLWSIHHDPNLWENPDKFDPNRFLNETKDKVIKPPYLVPFSGGKRACPGEGLANVETYLYLVNMVQRYNVKTEAGTKFDFEALFGITRRPKNQPRMIFEKVQTK